MSIQTTFSTRPLPEAIADLRPKRVGAPYKAVLFFASPGYDPAEVSRAMQQAFPDACVAGCSTAGEIACGRMMTGSIAAMFLDDEVVEDAAVAVVPGLHSGGDLLAKPLAALEDHFQEPIAELDFEKYVGLVLVDGLSGAEERLMDQLGDATDVLFVGGSAADDLKFQATHVYAQGQAWTDSAVLVLLRLRRGFEIVKTQSFRSTGKTLTATAVDEARRTVLEFDHRPALDAYAAALGVPRQEAAAHFFEYPLGLMVEGEPFVRSPQRAEGAGIVFYCQIKQGMQLEVLHAADIVADTLQAIEARRNRNEIRGLIDFNCILRTLQLRNENRCGDYAGIFHDIPMVGFSTYGEQYLGHVNQTSTMLLFR